MVPIQTTKTYPRSDAAFANAQIGYAPDVGSVCARAVTLRYLYLTWREVEPQGSVYAWDSIVQTYHLDALREHGIHLVLRFVCDFPGSTPHLDIPDWLYEQTQDGSWYHTEYGCGYSPDYSNAVFRAAHRRVLAALAGFLDDGFVSYVELGSLGHWGEWHVRSDKGLVPMPDACIRDQYVQDYLDAFHRAKLLMRRPFRVTAQAALGLYNDMVGHAAGTAEWLGWIRSGGWYGSDPHALVAMPDSWKTMPIGGELASDPPMQELLDTELPRTLRMIQASHMSFLGPLSADEAFPAGYDAILRHLGYRLCVSRLSLLSSDAGFLAQLTFANHGSAPFYWDWPVNLYLEDPAGRTLRTIALPIRLSGLLPGDNVSVTVPLPQLTFPASVHSYTLTVGIVDPMTGRDAVHFAMEADERNGRTVLWP